MNLLAIETALFQCSVALFNNGITSVVEADQPSQQCSQLFPLIMKLLEQNNLRLANIDAIACTIGPGSFTGVRIGIAAVRAIGKIIPHIKLLGISTLELVACAARHHHDTTSILIATIEAGRGEFYMQKFDSAIKPITDITLVTEDQLRKQLHPNEVVVYNQAITAKLVLGRALELLNSGVVHNTIHPLYIKAPSITKQKL